MSRARWSPALQSDHPREVIAHGTSPLYDAPDPGNLEPELFVDDEVPGEPDIDDLEAISTWFE